jgi:hypothetical protein
MHTAFWWESHNGGYHQKYRDIGGGIILKWILQKFDGVV